MRRVLMISPHFPPDSTAATHRVRLLAPHMADHGWQPTVLTVDPRDYEGRLDPALAASVPPNVRVVRTRAWPLRASRRFGVGDLGIRAFRGLWRGASDLMDRVGPLETLYSSPRNGGATKDFAGPTNKPIQELQQYASVRQGGLPNSSFAGYAINYIRYVNNQNPMPGLSGTPTWSSEMTRFDYVLARPATGVTDKRFQLLEIKEGWELYGVCGSKRFPTCP